MTARRVTPPAAMALSLAAAKECLKIDGTDQDAQISAWVAGIVGYVEFVTGRALINQGWRVTLDAFPAAIELPKSPTVTVTAVRYIDANGASQTLDPADYVVDTVSEPGYVVPARGKAWPATYNEINAVSVDCTCGYGPDETTVPAPISLYLQAKLREQYDPSVRADGTVVQSSFLDCLLDQFKVYA